VYKNWRTVQRPYTKGGIIMESTIPVLVEGEYLGGITVENFSISINGWDFTKRLPASVMIKLMEEFIKFKREK
jgi:hypothetical protein